MAELDVTLKVGSFSSDIGSFLLKKILLLLLRRESECVCERESE
jgi:hypothetical protein